MVLDIDHFKRFNDECGHAVGDALLRVLASSLRRLTRPEDVLARYGGEEFVVVVRGVGDANAAILAERIRRRISSLPLPTELSVRRVTVSIGVASLDPSTPYQTASELLGAADRAMYRAKAAGRNRVVTS
jgi:diguanylate cyclase (GGDEF)-like protein